ncbi:unnamed protein product [Spirodela intermedia]|uniref:Uncharacterized protein n=2 Tax=Spirodela intermedia TaxID=51605 RepID=A0A7I8IDV8_SPIIN|nr:unnamed protein product [Spirodela intermedia]CAA6656007.1 unnamed protein product [Spirodela intermedia]CAA7391438.1 unnamed protein product [Spirodela intermedia]
MANHDVTTLAEALATAGRQGPQRGVPSGGSAGLSRNNRFSDMELVAAQQLVMLSESSSEETALPGASGFSTAAAASSSSSTSLPSVSNALQAPVETTAAGEDEDGEEMSTGPSTRRRRYRSIRIIYEITSPIAGDGKWRNVAQRRKPNRA